MMLEVKHTILIVITSVEHSANSSIICILSNYPGNIFKDSKFQAKTDISMNVFKAT